MEKHAFIKYNAERYGIDESVAETMVDMFADSLQELIFLGHSVNIDEIGEFTTTPMFPKGLNHKNNIALAKAGKQNMVSFKASELLTKGVAWQRVLQ
jgi:nucleoid DNA-binding protein